MNKEEWRQVLPRADLIISFGSFVEFILDAQETSSVQQSPSVGVESQLATWVIQS